MAIFLQSKLVLFVERDSSCFVIEPLSRFVESLAVSCASAYNIYEMPLSRIAIPLSSQLTCLLDYVFSFFSFRKMEANSVLSLIRAIPTRIPQASRQSVCSPRSFARPPPKCPTIICLTAHSGSITFIIPFSTSFYIPSPFFLLCSYRLLVAFTRLLSQAGGWLLKYSELRLLLLR